MMTYAVILVCLITIFLPSIVIALKIKYEEKRDEKNESDNTTKRKKNVVDKKIIDLPKVEPKSEPIRAVDSSEIKNDISTSDVPALEKKTEPEQIKISDEKSEEPVTTTSTPQKEKKRRGRKPGKKNKTTSKPRKKGGDQLLLS